MRRVVVLLVLLAAACADDGGPVVEAPPAAELDGILQRTGQALAWTGEALFVYGGESADASAPYLGGAALVDPDTAAVTPLPEPPFDAPLETGGVAATSGGDVVLLGRTCAERVDVDADTVACRPGGLVGAQLSLDEGTWRLLDVPDGVVEQLSPDPEQDVRLLGVTGDDRVVLQLPHGRALPAGESRTWTYRAADGEWEELPAFDRVVDDSCLAGDRLVVRSSDLVDESTIDVIVGVLDLADGGWTTSPTFTAQLWGPALTCAGDTALVYSDSYDQGTFRLALDPMGSWEELPSPPDGIGFARQVAVGDRVLFTSQDGPTVGRLLDPVTFTWQQVELPPWRWPTLPVWTGDQLVVVDDGISTVELP